MTAATAPLPRTGRSSAKPASSRTKGEGFALAGPSRLPDPAYNAYRPDLADVALAGTVIASHYAQPLSCRVSRDTPLFAAPGGDELVAELQAGDAFDLLDNSLGWAWGYAGQDRRVGYIPSDAIA